MSAYVYVIECLTPNHFYVGATSHLASRVSKHRHGVGAQAVQKHGFKKLVRVIEARDMEQAKELERLMVLHLREKDSRYVVYGAGWTPTKETGVPN